MKNEDYEKLIELMWKYGEGMKDTSKEIAYLFMSLSTILTITGERDADDDLVKASALLMKALGEVITISKFDKEIEIESAINRLKGD